MNLLLFAPLVTQNKEGETWVSEIGSACLQGLAVFKEEWESTYGAIWRAG